MTQVTREEYGPGGDIHPDNYPEDQRPEPKEVQPLPEPEEEKDPDEFVVSEGMMGSTPDNEPVPAPEPAPPLTAAEMERVQSAGPIQPAIESQIASEMSAEEKPKTGEELKEAVEAENEARGSQVPDKPTSLNPSLDPDVVAPPPTNEVNVSNPSEGTDASEGADTAEQATENEDENQENTDSEDSENPESQSYSTKPAPKSS